MYVDHLAPTLYIRYDSIHAHLQVKVQAYFGFVIRRRQNLLQTGATMKCVKGAIHSQLN